MIVFKTALKVLNKCKGPIILYTVILVFFGIFNMQTSDNSTNFVASTPDVLIINRDEENGITKDLIKYISENSNIVKIEDNEEARNDALFYRDVNYIIYIPQGFREDFLNHKNPKIEIKSTGDYQSSLAEMMLERYLKLANIYNINSTEEEIINNIAKTIDKKVEIEITSKIDQEGIANLAFYYNFMNYAVLAGCIYVICLVLNSFREEKIMKRTIISSMNYKKVNRKLLLANGTFAFALWLAYISISFAILGKIMLTIQGMICIVNSFIFTMCALTIAFLIGNLVNNKNAINGIINVIALGSSFLCGAFVPMEWLPGVVLKIAHILPSYWYIRTNEMLKTIQEFNLDSMKPILLNMGMVIVFSVGFIIISNIVTKKKAKK